MEISLVISAVGLGLASGFHCIGMCGPIALSLGITRKQSVNFYLQNIIYQLGRVVSYAFLGGIFGLLGEGFSLIGFQRYLTIFAGLTLILMSSFSLGSNDFSNKIPLLQSFLMRIKINLGKYLKKSGYQSRFFTGVLNGLLPCGMVYMALTASIAYGGVKNGVLFMALFGMGTIPFMFAIVTLGDLINQAFRLKILKIIPFLMIIMGGIFILRGLELGIPYLSPKKEVLKIHKNGDKKSHESCH